MPIRWCDNIVIEELTDSEIAIVADIERQNPSSWSERQIGEELKGAGRVVLAARLSGTCVGWCCCRTCDTEAELLKVAVGWSFRRRGVGRSLLVEAGRRLAEIGARTVLLEVRAANSGAISFYRAMGYVVVGRRINYYRRPDDDALIMSAQLPQGE